MLEILCCVDMIENHLQLADGLVMNQLRIQCSGDRRRARRHERAGQEKAQGFQHGRRRVGGNTMHNALYLAQLHLGVNVPSNVVSVSGIPPKAKSELTGH